MYLQTGEVLIRIGHEKRRWEYELMYPIIELLNPK